MGWGGAPGAGNCHLLESGMAELSSSKRNSLPKKEFGEPGKRAYPMPDRAHAANAKARAKQQLDNGNLDQTTYDHICKMADTILGNSK